MVNLARANNGPLANSGGGELVWDEDRPMPAGLTKGQAQLFIEVVQWARKPYAHERIRRVDGLAGSGKATPLSEPVFTPSGWQAMGDIKPGSMVIGGDGKPAKVTAIYPHEALNMYKVTFCDGTFTYCCEDHLWKVQSPRQVSNGNSSVMPLSAMLERINTPRKSNKHSYWYSVPLCEPVELAAQDYAIDPYLMGWALAEVCMSGKQVTASVHPSEAADIYEELSGLLPEEVTLTRVKSHERIARFAFNFRFRELLKDIGLHGHLSPTKFVPKSYMLGSIEQRKALLAGLLDGDGTTQRFPSGKVKTAFHSSSEALARDVAELVRSLGGYAIVRKKKERSKNEEWRVSIRLWFNPFRLPYKRDKYGDYMPKMRRVKKIVSAEYVGVMPGQCITVANEDHLYLTRDFIVTHNTFVVSLIVDFLVQSGALGNAEVWVSAPTNKAVQVIEEAMAGVPVAQFTTADSLFMMRPKEVEWTEADEATLSAIMVARAQHPDNQELEARHAALTWKRTAAYEHAHVFQPTGRGLKNGFESCRLLIVDEWSMIQLATAHMYFELNEKDSVHSSLQILFLGDPMQLPPIGEKLSVVSKVKSIGPLLDEVMRSKGNVTNYTNHLRRCVTMDEARHLHLHYEDGKTILSLPQRIILQQMPPMIKAGDDVAIACYTNKRCDELNRAIRLELWGGDEVNGLRWHPQDKCLSVKAIVRGETNYGDFPEQNDGVRLEVQAVKVPYKRSKLEGCLQDKTSTIYELGNEFENGDYFYIAPGAGCQISDSIRTLTIDGQTFTRRFFHYREDGNTDPDEFLSHQGMILIDPIDYPRWKKLIEKLYRRARTTLAHGKTKHETRGVKSGDTVKEVWNYLGVKNWDKHLDGSAIPHDELRRMRGRLWAEYHTLNNFVDHCTLPFAMTVHKCLPGHTLIESSRGTIPIASVKAGDVVRTGEGNLQPVVNVWNTGDKQVFKVTTNSGSVLESSAVHRHLVGNSQGLEWKEARNITKGDYLCAARFGTESGSRAAKLPDYNGVPQKMTGFLSWLIGALVGNGSYNYRKDGRVDLCFNGKDDHLLDFAISGLKDYGIVPTVQKRNDSICSMYWHSVSFRKWLYAIGLGYSVAYQKSIPSFVLESTDDHLASCLRGLFDADGCAHKVKKVTYVTVSDKLKKQIMIALKRLGIHSYLESYGVPELGVHEAFYIHVTGPSLKVFREKVGFNNKRKQKRLKEYKLTGATNIDTIPFGKLICDEFRALCKGAKVAMSWVQGGKRVNRFCFVSNVCLGKSKLTYPRLLELMAHLAANGIEPSELMQECAERNYFYDQVISAESTSRKLPMFDIEVANEHSFIASGYVTHNCQGSTFQRVIIDSRSVLNGKWQHQPDAMPINALYTAVTRGAEQVVFLI